MSIFDYVRKLSYYPVPKCACSSLKMYFFEINNGFPFRDFWVNGTINYIHDIFPTMSFQDASSLDKEDQFRFAVLRDPVERLLSCYSNRVVHHGELSLESNPDSALYEGLVFDPSLEQFIDNLEAYRNFSPSIAHHSDPLTCFLGRDPGFFSKIYTLRRIGELVDDIEALTGTSVRLGHEQSGGPKISIDALSTHRIQKLKEFYAEDYEIFGKYIY